MADTYQIVTDRIIAQLEKGTVPWKKPWCNVRGAYNRVTGKPYSLMNQLMLDHPGGYASFRQWTKLGGKVKRGEKAEIIVFWKWPEECAKNNDCTEDDKDGEKLDPISPRPILKYHPVFHYSQVDGVDPDIQETELFDARPIEKAEKLLRSYVSREHISVEDSLSNQAYYSPTRDLIRMPALSQYSDPKDYYITAFHEAIHSTGHSRRLNRLSVTNLSYGSEMYGKEELVAELGSSYLMNSPGLTTETTLASSAAYISGWIEALRSDKRLVVGAAAQAEKAAKYIVGH